MMHNSCSADEKTVPIRPYQAISKRLAQRCSKTMPIFLFRITVPFTEVESLLDPLFLEKHEIRRVRLGGAPDFGIDLVEITRRSNGGGNKEEEKK